MMREGDYRLWRGEVFKVIDAESIQFIESGVTIRNHTAWDFWMESSKASTSDIVKATNKSGSKTWIGK